MTTHHGAAHPRAAHQGSADPVCELLGRHRELCERAVDPLEIAAVLEARGVTDRAAARFKHRDVFSLAEELYARAPHPAPDAVDGGAVDGGSAGGAAVGRCPADGRGPADERADDGARDGAPVAGGAVAVGKPRVPVFGGRSRAGGLVLPLLPGALCAVTLGVLALVRDTPPYARWAVVAVGGVAVCAGVRLALRALPLPKALVVWGSWLVVYALFGDWLLGELLGGGPETLPAPPATPPPGAALTLALSLAPAIWCARGFSVGALRRLAGSRSLEEFAAGVRPLLAAAVALFACCLLALQWAVGACARALVGAGAADRLTLTAAAAVTGLALLLFTTLLLTAHGFGGVASAGLATACGVEAAALAAVLAARLPGLTVLGRPVERAVAFLGTPAVPLTACGCAALGLLAYASMTLTGASAHHREAAPT